MLVSVDWANHNVVSLHDSDRVVDLITFILHNPSGSLHWVFIVDLRWQSVLVSRLFHLLDRLSIMINYVALIGQIGVKETTKNHNLVVRYGDRTQLRSFLVLEFSVKIDELPCLLL